MDVGPISATAGEQWAAAMIKAGQHDQAAQLNRQRIAWGQARALASANLAILLEATAPTAELVALLR